MTLIAPEKKHPIPRERGAGIRCEEIVEIPGSRSTGKRDGKAPAFGHSLVGGVDHFLRCRFE